MASLVDKATSDMLIGPDWAMNMEICDLINHDPGLAKDVVKAIKKRLGHRNPKVQLLALTVLETIVKNCGVIVHQQVAEKDVLHEMVKIVKRKTDMHVRDKILVLLSSWSEAFGGPRGRYPQYFMAVEELRRMGVEFPDRPAERDAPIFTPPQTHPVQAQPLPGYGSPAHMPSRLEALMNNDLPGLSLTEIETARGRVEVLLEMLNAVNPRDRQAVKDDLIVELVEQCRSTQQRVMSLVNNTSDEELLRQGLALNDDLQRVLEKHDAIASGKAPPREPVSVAPKVQNKPAVPVKKEEDDFAKLRSSKPQPAQTSSSDDPFVQLALPAPPSKTATVSTPVSSSSTPQKKMDFIDLLSGELQDTTPSAPATPPVPSAPATPPVPSAPPDLSSENPFGPAFHATPTSFGSSQQQQPQPFGNAYNSSQFGTNTFDASQQQYQQQANGSTYPNTPNQAQQFGNSSFGLTPDGSSFNGQQQQQQQQSQTQQYGSNSFDQPQQPQQAQQFGSNTFPQQQQQQQHVNGSAYTPMQNQQQQGQAGTNTSQDFSFPQYQSYVQDSYVAPWALPRDQLSPQQQALIYGSQSPSQPTMYGSQAPSQPTPSPWTAPQQQMYGGYNYGYGSAYGPQYPYADQYTYQYGASSYYQNGMSSLTANNQLALVPVTSAASNASGSPAKPANPKDKLFEDLVDLQSLNSKFKSAGISSSLSGKR